MTGGGRWSFRFRPKRPGGVAGRRVRRCVCTRRRGHHSLRPVPHQNHPALRHAVLSRATPRPGCSACRSRPGTLPMRGRSTPMPARSGQAASMRSQDWSERRARLDPAPAPLDRPARLLRSASVRARRCRGLHACSRCAVRWQSRDRRSASLLRDAFSECPGSQASQGLDDGKGHGSEFPDNRLPPGPEGRSGEFAISHRNRDRSHRPCLPSIFLELLPSALTPRTCRCVRRPGICSSATDAHRWHKGVTARRKTCRGIRNSPYGPVAPWCR
ncbi:hypothetical protein FB547_105329 [Variovorax beijingensis]|uniref:Uncharacterized protein n=1 Tax=Variovorax beijingensis TaxID=2496117 RepID=A0A561C485_9BURK|nr:hypothetical protein FB547_105329 [Variovorax beijingensis]